jgi:hypothetical protein
VLNTFFRITIYIPIEDASHAADSLIVTSESVQPILRVLGTYELAGAVGTYKAVAEISTGIETYTPTESSQPASGAAGSPSVVRSARLVTYIPSLVSIEELSSLTDEIAAAHPWEHPVIEVDRTYLWMPH